MILVRNSTSSKSSSQKNSISNDSNNSHKVMMRVDADGVTDIWRISRWDLTMSSSYEPSMSLMVMKGQNTLNLNLNQKTGPKHLKDFEVWPADAVFVAYMQQG